MSDEEKRLFSIFGICVCVIFIFFFLAVLAMIGIEADNKQKEDMILQQSIGRTIKSYTREGSTIYFHYENGGGFSIRGYKGITIE